MPDSSWLLYGANGYTGERIAREAVARGQRPVLAGRNAGKIEPLAKELNCPSRVFDLAPTAACGFALKDVRAVLNCAGPFSATGGPMMDACLAAGASYLDITGEIAVIEAAAARKDRAVAAGVSLIPAVGFDVVPSDCLAAMLARRLPGATHLQLAFAAASRISPGTARTMIQRMGDGGQIRADGRIVRVPLLWKTMEVPFPAGRQTAMTLAWGDVATAWYTTGIPNIEVYAAVPPRQIAMLRRMRWLLPLLGLGPVRAIFGGIGRRFLTGMMAQEGQSERAALWGRASDAVGNTVEATLETPEGYQLTVLTALVSLQKVLAGGISPGFHTPAQAFGPEFILSIPGTKLHM